MRSFESPALNISSTRSEMYGFACSPSASTRSAAQWSASHVHEFEEDLDADFRPS